MLTIRQPASSGALRRWSLRLLPAVLLTAPAYSAVRSPPPGQPVILPAAIQLSGPKARQQLLVEARDGARFTGDLTPRARFSSSNLRVVTVDASGVVRPMADGTATITASVGARR